MNLHYFVNAIECILFRILHGGTSLKIHIRLYYRHTVALFTHIMHLYNTLQITERHLHVLNPDCNCKEKKNKQTAKTTLQQQ